MPLETIPIPTDQAKHKEPMRLEVYDLDILPNERFEILFDWNGFMQRWIVEFRHLETGTTFFKGPASLYREYAYDGTIAFMFLDPSKEAEAVTPSNIGDSVWLAVMEAE